MKSQGRPHLPEWGRSHPTRGAWIEIILPRASTEKASRRTPHGVRGLKWLFELPNERNSRRTPHGVRGLKSVLDYKLYFQRPCRTPHGVRGLKYTASSQCSSRCPGRTPHGVRGLKYPLFRHIITLLSSHPTRGAWIEIADFLFYFPTLSSHPTRGAWIEIPAPSGSPRP